jgi:hypothetical protein
MRSRLAFAALALSLAVGACDQNAPTSANTATDNQQNAPDFKKDKSALLTNVPVTGTTVADVGGATGTFAGTVTITHFAYDQTSKTLRVDGVLKDATGAVVKRFTNVDATLTASGSPTAPTCSILVLDIGAIHLDLLGLVVDLAPVHLNVHAVGGPGNLLGNLLCALANLLNQPSPLLSAITNLLDRINAILAGL